MIFLLLYTHTQEEDPEAIKKETGWLSMLGGMAFGDGEFPDIDTNNNNNENNNNNNENTDNSSEEKTKESSVDMSWLQETTVCPILDIFADGINQVENFFNGSLSPTKNQNDSRNGKTYFLYIFQLFPFSTKLDCFPFLFVFFFQTVQAMVDN